MKILRILSVIFICISINSNAQNGIGFQWQRTFGEAGRDFANGISKTADGGFIIAGTTDIMDSSEVWIMKFNVTGALEWDRTYGGTGHDVAYKIIETSDGSYVFVATSTSSDGDVTVNKGVYDVWVSKLSPTGDIVWQRTFGGSREDRPVNLAETFDGGIVFASITSSTDGDVVGKTGVDPDIWVVKLNSTGSEIVWQKLYGGSSIETFSDFRYTSDGGFICGGSSISKDRDFKDSITNANFLVKLDGDGNKIFAKKIVGTELHMGNTVLPAIDGGFFMAGSYGRGAYIAKMDATGSLVWNNHYNIPLDTAQRIYELCYSPDSTNLFFIGESVPFSAIPGRSWIGEVAAANGNLNWYNVFPNSGSTFLADMIIHSDGFPLMAGSVRARLDPIRYASPDVLLLKFGATNRLKGTLFFDSNKNGVKDAGEYNFNDAIIKTQKDSDVRSSLPFNGSFTLDVDTGSYVTSAQPLSPYYSAVPATKNSAFSTYSNIDSFSFAIQPIPGKRDLTINIIPLTVARPGFNMPCRLYYKNNGTDTIPAGEIVLVKDPRLNFLSASPAQFSINGDTVKWSYSNLKPLDTASILINLQVLPPPSVNINDTLFSFAAITPVEGDLTPSDDTTILNQTVFGSYDPNDKSENLAGKISEQQVANNAYINYLIRFQNTGTDTAFNIVIRDTLDDKLDWSSLQMVAASHPYQLNIKSQNQLVWSFNDIQLVDSFSNEPGSHGFIAFRVKPKSSLIPGDIIRNTASIYFDYNLPIETNTQETTVVLNYTGNPPVDIPTITSFTPSTAAMGTSVTITGTNLNGATAVSFGGVAATSFNVISSTTILATVGIGASGNVSVTTPGGKANSGGFTFDVGTAIDPLPVESMGIRIFPNPTTGTFTIDSLKLTDNWETMEIFNVSGMSVLSKINIRGKTKVNHNVSFLPTGQYNILLRRKDGSSVVLKFVRQ